MTEPGANIDATSALASTLMASTTTMSSMAADQHTRMRPRRPLYARKISHGLSVEEVAQDIELASHYDSDKILQMESVLGGSINITNIEEINGDSRSKRGNGETASKQEKQQPSSSSSSSNILSIGKLWKRRHSRTAEEGIRSETTTGKELSSLLERASSVTAESESARRRKTSMARTIAGLVVALAEEAEDLEVEVDARRDTPMWGKQVDSIKINFSKLGFKQLRMNGLSEAIRDFEADLNVEEKDRIAESISSEPIFCMDEAFDRIDVDNSGALDEDEIADALSKATNVKGRRAKRVMAGLASRLVRLYDADGNGVVDREEYQAMVRDMSALREAKQERLRKKKEEIQKSSGQRSWFRPRELVGRVFRRGRQVSESKSSAETKIEKARSTDVSSLPPKVNGKRQVMDALNETSIDLEAPNVLDISDDPALIPQSTKEGYIELSDLKLDLRRLLFGAFPGIKKITPGGPLVLEPFTMTVNAAFSREDILTSTLLDMGLRLLVERVLKKRIRPIRDFVDGAVFYGRKWYQREKAAPLTEVVELSDIEWTKDNKFIFTGRVRVRASPDAPTIENSFKLRARLGTWGGGKYIGIIDPELALVLECPSSWERNIKATFRRFKMKEPERPPPIYTFFPLPLKEKTGYYLGEDNMIKSVYIKDEALRFEISAVVRPGRFLGNHYIAFTVPQRTFIITVERIREGMRVARKNKLAADAAKEALANASRQKVLQAYDKLVAESVSEREIDDDMPSSELPQVSIEDIRAELELIDFPEPENDPFADRPGFFGRFVEGYLGANADSSDAEDEVLDERLASAISDWFGRQGKTSRRSLVDRAMQQVTDAYDVEGVNGDKRQSQDETLG